MEFSNVRPIAFTFLKVSLLQCISFIIKAFRKFSHFHKSEAQQTGGKKNFE